jgi:RsiW-degrading membrane proteinase PrsW (M82 family)
MALLIIIIIQILIITWLINYLLHHDNGPREPRAALFGAGLFGVLGVVIGMVLEFFLIPASSLPSPGQTRITAPIIEIIISCAIIGLVEEFAKSGPLARWIYKKSYFNEVSDGIIYFGIAGLVFGAIENIGYALAYGPAVGLDRIITIPFMHGGFASIIGFAVARHKLLGGSKATIYGAYFLAAALHGFYDFGLFYRHTWSIYSSLAITVIANFIIFQLYDTARKEDYEHGLAGPPA